MSARMTFIAHAATDAQRNAAFPLDDPIVERERARIANAGRNFSAARHVWSAPEQRAQETSRVLGLQAEIADQLRDCDYGKWRGKGIDVVQKEDPEGFLAWLTDSAATPHGGESIEDLIRRVGAWMDSQSQVKHTIAVTHPAVVRAAIVYALRLSPPIFWRFDIAPTTITDLRFSRGVWTVRCTSCSLVRAVQPEAEEIEI